MTRFGEDWCVPELSLTKDTAVIEGVFADAAFYFLNAEFG